MSTRNLCGRLLETLRLHPPPWRLAKLSTAVSFGKSSVSLVWLGSEFPDTTSRGPVPSSVFWKRYVKSTGFLTDGWTSWLTMFIPSHLFGEYIYVCTSFLERECVYTSSSLRGKMALLYFTGRVRLQSFVTLRGTKYTCTSVPCLFPLR